LPPQRRPRLPRLILLTPTTPKTKWSSRSSVLIRHFHRTSSPENKEMTQHFFNRLKKNGFTYTKEVEQRIATSASVSPDRFVVGTCPHCKALGIYSDYCEMCGKALHGGELQEPKCINLRTKPTTKKTKHYFLKLSAFSKKLEDCSREQKPAERSEQLRPQLGQGRPD